MIFYIVKTIRVEEIDGDEICNDSSDAIYIESQTAYDTIKFNYGDLSEQGYNQYAVVLATTSGLYPAPQELSWFVWDKEEEKYIQCDRPDFMEGYSLTI